MAFRPATSLPKSMLFVRNTNTLLWPRSSSRYATSSRTRATSTYRLVVSSATTTAATFFLSGTTAVDASICSCVCLMYNNNIEFRTFVHTISSVFCVVFACKSSHAVFWACLQVLSAGCCSSHGQHSAMGAAGEKVSCLGCQCPTTASPYSYYVHTA